MRISFRLLLLAAGAVLAAAAGSATAVADPSVYTRYAGCSPDGAKHTRPTHVCQQGDQIWAVLRYSDAPIEYKVCLRFGEGERTCGDSLVATPGTPSIAYLPTKNFAGLVTVSWWAGSRHLGSYAIRFVEDPIVPSFGMSPLIVAGTHRLFGLIVRHVSPGLRVRAWRQCPGVCPLKLRLVASKGETLRYRVAPRDQLFSLGDVLVVQLDAPGRGKGRSRLWGRLYQGRLVRDRGGSPTDTAIKRFGPRLCTPPGGTFQKAIECSKVRAVQPPA